MNNSKENNEELTAVHCLKISFRELWDKFQFLAKGQYRKYEITTWNKVGNNYNKN